MGLETATYIGELNSANPTASDPISAGDDHIRLLKQVLLATLPNLTGAVSASHEELNYLDGVTSNVQTQLEGKAAAAHSHTEDDIEDGDIYPRIGANELITGTWQFQNLLTALANVYVYGTGAYALTLQEAGGSAYIRQHFRNLDWPVDQRRWINQFGLNIWGLYTIKDDGSTSRAVLSATRSGVAVTSVAYGNATDNPGHSFYGNVAVNGALSSSGAANFPSLTVGNVSNTEFGYLDGVTSNIQTQLNGKAASAHTHSIDDVTDFPATSGSFTMTLRATAGGSILDSDTAYYTLQGNVVTLVIPALFVSDANTSYVLQGLPVGIRPNLPGVGNMNFICFGQDNSANVAVRALLPDSVDYINLQALDGTFAATGQKGIYQSAITYLLS